MLQVGAVAVVLAAVTWKEFELDRFYVPKELVLHVTALVAGLLVFEQSLVSPADLSQVKRAFDLNGWVGVLYLVATAVDVYIS